MTMTREQWRAELERRAEHGPTAFLYREALQHDYINLDEPVGNRCAHRFLCRGFDGQDRAMQLRAYLCESLLTALEHAEPLIRLRATLQAYDYSGQLRGMNRAPSSAHADALLDARNRIEAEIKGR